MPGLRARDGERPCRRRLSWMHAARALAVAGTVVCASGVTVSDARAALSVATTAAPTFAVTLDGTDRAATYALPLSVSDTTGTGAGWHLAVTSTPFSTGGGVTPRLLPESASSITAATGSCAVAPCTDPVNTITVPRPIPAAPTPPEAEVFFNAEANSGMGEFTITANVRVIVPANAYAGTYTSELTLSVVSGP
jgi:hypothetical protein